jgi:MazG family protein
VKEIEQLRQTVATLRGPNGCPWDREQDHRSLCICLVEECSELLETIDRLDMEHMREELGDVLLQVVFHAQMAEEKGIFRFEDVAKEINDKLIRRHPHVFGNTALDNSEQVLQQWDAIKAAEKKGKVLTDSVFKDLPPALPALLYALDVYKRARKNDMLTADCTLSRRVQELKSRIADEQSMGEELLALVGVARERGWDPESLLRRAANALKDHCENPT